MNRTNHTVAVCLRAVVDERPETPKQAAELLGICRTLVSHATDATPEERAEIDALFSRIEANCASVPAC
jgi:hypothetical protein